MIQVGEDGQTFLQQVITTGSEEPQQTFVQVAADDSQTAGSFEGVAQGTVSAATGTVNESFVQQNIENMKPGQSLLLPGAVPSKQPQAQVTLTVHALLASYSILIEILVLLNEADKNVHNLTD